MIYEEYIINFFKQTAAQTWCNMDSLFSHNFLFQFADVKQL